MYPAHCWGGGGGGGGGVTQEFYLGPLICVTSNTHPSFRASGYTLAEVALHGRREDAWMAVDGKVGPTPHKNIGETSFPFHTHPLHVVPPSPHVALLVQVYDVTHFFAAHPGGASALLKGVGQDATSLFRHVHAHVDPDKRLKVRARVCACVRACVWC